MLALQIRGTLRRAYARRRVSLCSHKPSETRSADRHRDALPRSQRDAAIRGAMNGNGVKRQQKSGRVSQCEGTAPAHCGETADDGRGMKGVTKSLFGCRSVSEVATRAEQRVKNPKGQFAARERTRNIVRWRSLEPVDFTSGGRDTFWAGGKTKESIKVQNCKAAPERKTSASS